MTRQSIVRVVGALGLVAGLACPAGRAVAQNDVATTAGIEAALTSTDVNRQRAGLSLIADLYENYNPFAESLPAERELENALRQRLLTAMIAFEKGTHSNEVIALWLRAYGRLFPPAVDAAQRFTNYLSREPKPYPPLVTRAAAEAHARLLRLYAESIRQRIFASPYRPEEYMALALGAHPAAPALFFNDEIIGRMTAFVDEIEGVEKMTRPLFTAAGLAAANPDSETRRYGLDAMRSLVARVRGQVNDPRLSPADEIRRVTSFEAQAKVTALAGFLRSISAELGSVRAGLESKDPPTRKVAMDVAREIGVLFRLERLNRRYAIDHPPLLLPVKNEPYPPEVRALLDPITVLSRDPDPQTRLDAAEAIEGFETEAWSHRAAVAELTKDKDVFVRWVAARSIGQMLPVDATFEDSQVVVAALTRLALDVDIDVRMAALRSLSQYGFFARAATDSVLIAMTRGDQDARVAAVSAFESVATPERAAQALVEILSKGDTRVRQAAAAALGRIGPVTKDVVPALQVALTDEDAEVRRQAGQALVMMYMKK